MTDTTQKPPVNKITIPPVPPDSNGLAIASLILGIMSFAGFFIFTGIPAVITGIMSLRRGQKERAMSIAGIILGSIATLLSLVFVLIVVAMVIFGANLDYAPQMDSEPYYDDSSMPLESTRT